MISVEQIKAARVLLHLDQADLARRAEVSLPTIQRVENPKLGPERSSLRVVQAIKGALEAAGVEFLDTADGKGEGVRLRSPRSTGSATT
ncbi:helix-turn-helix transcriptional regulator [Rhodobaculum claviforme]|uniref:HTH cro/C1-type domain-containing protein n=1 Tax=Rhodobaculum claviforme TaxID=1549854 RepID=A0A934TIT9_9RHOB|nr:helix-turn-helix transcriptional regulator [Rhodobaculum claviforme]MBK5925788.1 hypothetical protein [Rhodobaculum claviforme]